MLDADKRERLRQLRAEVKVLESPKREAAKIARAKARKASNAARKAAPMAGQREPRQHDANYLAWIRGLKCIGCVQDQTPSRSVRSEAAHVRFADARAGWSHTGKGEKPHDRRTLPLCAGHHRQGPKSQHAAGERAWWEARGIHAPSACAALEAAYEAGADGNDVIRRLCGNATSIQTATKVGSSREGTKREAQTRPNPNPTGTTP